MLMPPLFLLLFIIFIVLLLFNINFEFSFGLNFNTISLFLLNCKISFGFLPNKEKSLDLELGIGKIPGNWPLKCKKYGRVLSRPWPKVAPKYLILFENARKKFILYKSTFRNTNIPRWIGFWGVSIECLVIVLYGLILVLLPLGHARLRFYPVSSSFWHQTFFLLESQ